jgi:hypothetical protein
VIRFFALILFGLPISAVATDGDAEEFIQAIGSFVGKAPLTITYHYTLRQDDFRQDTTGTLILFKSNVFRLTFWDKVYGSDGTTLYVHDKNTRQTIIDSLRWTELHPWLQILNGELPRSTRIRQLPSDGELLKWSLSHRQQMWTCTVVIDTLTDRFTEIRLSEEEWEHILLLDIPHPYQTLGMKDQVTLRDLPGVRLDLR